MSPTAPTDTPPPTRGRAVEVERKPRTFSHVHTWIGYKRRLLALANRNAIYHAISHLVEEMPYLVDEEKEALRMLLNRMSDFLGVKLLTYCIMGNHFHALLEVPNRDHYLQRFQGPEGEAKLLAHLDTFYSSEYMRDLRAQLQRYRSSGAPHLAEQLLQSYKDRFCDLPRFMKEVKERFTRWFNARHERRGTVWMERYTSVLVEGGEPGEAMRAIKVMAAYIDLNPVRAGIVTDPGEYRWCGYADAMRGSARAKRGLSRVMEVPESEWAAEGRPRYRTWLFEKGVEKRTEGGTIVRKGVDPELRKTVLATDGNPDMAEQLRRRIRAFHDGTIIGSAAFLDKMFTHERDKFSPRRRRAAQRIPNLPKDSGLASYRQLR